MDSISIDECKVCSDTHIVERADFAGLRWFRIDPSRSVAMVFLLLRKKRSVLDLGRWCDSRLNSGRCNLLKRSTARREMGSDQKEQSELINNSVYTDRKVDNGSKD